MIPPAVEVLLVLLAEIPGQRVQLALHAPLGVLVVVGVDRLDAAARGSEDRRIHVGGVQPLPEQQADPCGGGHAQQCQDQDRHPPAATSPGGGAGRRLPARAGAAGGRRPRPPGLMEQRPWSATPRPPRREWTASPGPAGRAGDRVAGAAWDAGGRRTCGPRGGHSPGISVPLMPDSRQRPSTFSIATSIS